MTASGITFEFDSELNIWRSKTKISFLGNELEVWMSANGGADFNQQGEILTQALPLLLLCEEEVKQRLFEFYEEACQDFDDIGETELLAKIDSVHSVNQLFGWSLLEIPEQLPGRGVTFKIVGGCSWNENDGVQLFFRDGILEEVDSAAAFFV